MTRQWCILEDSVWPFVNLHLGILTGKYKDSKGTSLECAELIYVKTMETACVSDE